MLPDLGKSYRGISRSAASSASSATQRPDSLQRLRVQPTDSPGKETTGSAPNSSILQNKKRYASSKLEDLLAKGPGATGAAQPRQSSLPSKSATQSNLTGSPKKSGASNLVDFFQKRLAEASRATEEVSPKTNTNKTSSFRDTIRSPRSPQFGDPSRSRLSLIRKPHPVNLGGLKAAKAEARTAQVGVTDTDRKVTPTAPLGGSINEHLNNSLSGVNIASKEEESEKKQESISPIRQFIMEIKKKTPQQKPNERLAKESSNSSNPPSWRKSVQRFHENKSVDPLFSSSQYTQEEPEEPMMDPYQLHLAGQEEKTKVPRIVKAQTIVLPSHEVTIKELSAIFGLKVGKIMKMLEALGETPVNDDAYTIGKCSHA